jgi:hypothetical protein
MYSTRRKDEEEQEYLQECLQIKKKFKNKKISSRSVPTINNQQLQMLKCNKKVSFYIILQEIVRILTITTTERAIDEESSKSMN